MTDILKGAGLEASEEAVRIIQVRNEGVGLEAEGVERGFGELTKLGDYLDEEVRGREVSGLTSSF